MRNPVVSGVEFTVARSRIVLSVAVTWMLAEIVNRLLLLRSAAQRKEEARTP